MTNINDHNRPVLPIDAITEIARQQLDIDTLEERGGDALDFYNCAVWSIKAALREAYLLGHRTARQDTSEPCDQAVLARDLRIDLLEQFARTGSTDAERFVAHFSWVSEDPMTTLRTFADNHATNALTPQLAEAARKLLRRLRVDNSA